MIESVLNKFGNSFDIHKRDVGTYSTVKKGPLRFDIEAYEMEGIGYMSAIRMKAFFGLMKMDTIVISPMYVDCPLFSIDKIKAMGNDTLLLEFYNMQLEDIDLSKLDALKENVKDLPDHDLGEHWYDYLKMSPTVSKRAKKMEGRFNTLIDQYEDTYIEMLKNEKKCIKEEKQKKYVEYVDGMFEKGSPTTEQFTKFIGKENAYELFTKFVFSSKA